MKHAQKLSALDLGNAPRDSLRASFSRLELSESSLREAQVETLPKRGWLRWYTKLLVVTVGCLIFVGALVSSHDAGLSVPDWPLTYGQNPFLFPYSLWQGAIFYEHSHRLFASLIGALTVGLALWMWRVEPRRWLRRLSFFALALVCVQGVLGGLTVLYLLPTPVSVLHGVVAQTFFVLTIIIAYHHSDEKRYARQASSYVGSGRPKTRLMFLGKLLVATVFLQLVLGATMRHSGAGLAVPDFPTMGGAWWPSWSADTLAFINAQLAKIGRLPVDAFQVAIHLAHRGGAVLVLFVLSLVVMSTRSEELRSKKTLATVKWIALVVALQLGLGIFTVLSGRSPVITSFHVVTGALLLGLSVLLVLRMKTLEHL